MACWDAAARIRGLPLCTALGGGLGESVDAVPLDPARWRRTRPPPCARRHLAEGYRRLQVKVGGDPAADAERLAAVRDAAGAGHRALRRRQRRLEHRRGAAVRPAGRRCRPRARAALRNARRVPPGARALCDADGAGREHRLDGRAARRLARRHRRRRDDQDRPGRRRHPGGGDPRRRRRAGADGHGRGHGRRRASTRRPWRTSRSRRRSGTACTPSTSTPGSRSTTQTGCRRPADGRLAPPDGPGLGVRVLDGALGDPFLQVP